MADFPKLVVLSEKLRGKSFELNREQLTLGRREPCDVVIKDGSVSSHHCDFICQDGTYFIIDCDSTNGTRVNNVPLQPNAMTPLKNSDLLQIGNVEVMFDFNDGSSPVISRTQTGIDLTTTDTGLTTVKDFANLSPFASNDTQSKERNRKLTTGLIIAAGAVIAVLVIWLIVRLLSL